MGTILLCTTLIISTENVIYVCLFQWVVHVCVILCVFTYSSVWISLPTALPFSAFRSLCMSSPYSLSFFLSNTHAHTRTRARTYVLNPPKTKSKHTKKRQRKDAVNANYYRTFKKGKKCSFFHFKGSFSTERGDRKFQKKIKTEERLANGPQVVRFWKYPYT